MLYRYSDLETPLQLECTVSGALSFVLHMSRIAAIAPIKFEKVRGGWRISLSRFYYAYTILFVILSHIITGFNTFDRREELVDGYESSSNKQSMPVLIAVLYTMGIVVGIPIAVTGDKRLRYIINCLFYVEQLEKTKHLVKQLMRYTPRDDSVFYHELKMFQYHISLNPVSFYSMHLLKFDRKLSIAVLSLVMTYLSVVISL
ncbi:unnamed protein product [Arctia plantaginis]|uniref:Gustatory receptor n=1 Tax=Arctia plantaginis TaxID=874455 RepID=A0A8S0ZN46_ARCPL|nr:unnamed protein product [Arctia plantaginis]